MTAGVRGRLAAVRQRATDSRGIALTEMIVVLAILVVVLTALTQLFVSASTAEVDMSKRVQAQQDARLALDKLRREIHCAKEVSWTPPCPRPRSASRSARTARPTPPEPRRLSRGARRAPARRLRRSGATRTWRRCARDHRAEVGRLPDDRRRCSRTTPPPGRRPARNAQRRPACRSAARRCEAAVHAHRTTSSCETHNGDEPRTAPLKGWVRTTDRR